MTNTPEIEKALLLQLYRRKKDPVQYNIDDLMNDFEFIKNNLDKTNNNIKEELSRLQDKTLFTINDIRGITNEWKNKFRKNGRFIRW